MGTETVRKSRLILSVDPFEQRLRPSRKALRELHHWAKRMASGVEAVHVLKESPRLPKFNQIYTKAYDRMKLAVRNLDLPVPVGVKMLWDEDDSGADPAILLTDYARDSGADLILVSSHGRRWLSRMVLGSFAEKVLLHASVPVLFFGLLPGPHDALGKVLFATDFSEASKTAFDLFLKQIRPMDAEVVILHVAEYPNLITGMSLTGVGAYLPETYWKVMKESLVNEGEQWVAHARERGMRARAVIEDGLGDVAAAILKTARVEHVSLIGLSSVRSELQKVVMGSISTRVFRSHGNSVWVCGPRVFENPMISAPPRHVPAPPRELR